MTAGMHWRETISIIDLSSISIMPAYWSCMASARARVSSLLITPSFSKSAMFFSATSDCVASVPETVLGRPRLAASTGHSAE